MTGSNFWSIFLSICSSTASRMTFAWAAKSCSKFLVCSESSFSSRASVTGFKFWVFSDWGLSMENKTGGLTLLSISSGEKLSKHRCGFPCPPNDEFFEECSVDFTGVVRTLQVVEYRQFLWCRRGPQILGGAPDENCSTQCRERQMRVLWCRFRDQKGNSRSICAAGMDPDRGAVGCLTQSPSLLLETV